MAVFTPVTATDLAAFLMRYDVGIATSFKGIAEGVQNSNFLVETTRGRFILTLYEERVDLDDLPWFLALMTHLADKGLPVPRPVTDRDGVALQTLNGRPACMIEFVTGVSVSEPAARALPCDGRGAGPSARGDGGFPAAAAQQPGGGGVAGDGRPLPWPLCRNRSAA